MQPNSRTVFFSTENISRKVMLYDCRNNTAAVVDYMRKLRSLPYELIFPVYPEKDDMLLIQGELPYGTPTLSRLPMGIICIRDTIMSGPSMNILTFSLYAESINKYIACLL